MKVLTRLLGKVVSQGTLSINYADGTCETIGAAAQGWPDVVIRFTDDAAARAIVTSAVLGAGEGFMDGKLLIEQGSIWDLIMLVSANAPLESEKTLETPSMVGQVAERLKHWHDNYNKRDRSRANVAHHYDLSDTLYDLSGQRPAI